MGQNIREAQALIKASSHSLYLMTRETFDVKTERKDRQVERDGAKTHFRNVIKPFKLVCSEDDSAVFIS